MALRYWLLIVPLRRVVPPGNPLAITSTGGESVPLMQLTSAPSCFSPFTRSMMGLSRIRCTPSSTKRPCPRVNAAVKGRMAVPAFPSIKVASVTGIVPDVPLTEILF